jgi:hypothetical protein
VASSIKGVKFLGHLSDCHRLKDCTPDSYNLVFVAGGCCLHCRRYGYHCYLHVLCFVLNHEEKSEETVFVRKNSDSSTAGVFVYLEDYVFMCGTAAPPTWMAE